MDDDRAPIGVDGLAADLARQREFLAADAPGYARLLGLLADALDGPAGERLREAWRDRAFGAWYERPLLLLAALRFAALRQGRGHPLWRSVAAPDLAPGSASADAVARALAADRAALWTSLRARSVQTNETSRAVVWLWPLALVPADESLELFDLGASAGLNLVADRLDGRWLDTEGSPLELARPRRIARRLGLDLAPLDVRKEEEADWLRACVWPERRDRLARLEAAIAELRRMSDAGEGPELVACDASEMPGHLVPMRSDSRLVAYQSIFADYLEPVARQAFDAGMRRWLAHQPPGRALWLELEIAHDGAPPARSARLVARVLDAGGEVAEIVLARCHPHPHELALDAAAVARFRALATRR